MKASIGRIVVTKGIAYSNGTDEHPAIINRAWSDRDTVMTPVGVNLTVFPDFMTPQHAGSVLLYDTKADALEAIASGQAVQVAYWPERV